MPSYDRTPTTSQVIQSGLNAVGTAIDIRDKIIRDQAQTDLLYMQARYDQDERDFLQQLETTSNYDENFVQNEVNKFMAKRSAATKDKNSPYYCRNAFTAKKMDEMFARQDASLRNKVEDLRYRKMAIDTMARQRETWDLWIEQDPSQVALDKITYDLNKQYGEGKINYEQLSNQLRYYQDKIVTANYTKAYDKYFQLMIDNNWTLDEYNDWLDKNYGDTWKAESWTYSPEAADIAAHPIKEGELITPENSKPATYDDLGKGSKQNTQEETDEEEKPEQSPVEEITNKDLALKWIKQHGPKTVTAEMVKDLKEAVDGLSQHPASNNPQEKRENAAKRAEYSKILIKAGFTNLSENLDQIIKAVNVLTGEENVEEEIPEEQEATYKTRSLNVDPKDKKNDLSTNTPETIKGVTTQYSSQTALDKAKAAKNQEAQSKISSMQKRNAGHFSEQVTKMFQIKDPLQQFYFAQSQLRDIENNYSGLKLSENDRMQYNNIFNIMLKASSDKESGGKVSNSGDALKLMESWWKVNPDSYIASWMQGGHEAIFANAYVMKDALVADFIKNMREAGISDDMIQYSLWQNKPIIEGIVEKAIETRYGAGKTSSGKTSILKQVQNMFKELEYGATEDQIRYVAGWVVDYTASKTVQDFSDADFANALRTMTETVFSMNTQNLFMDDVSTAKNFGKAIATFESKDMLFTDQYGDYQWLPVAGGTVQKQWEQDGGIYQQGRKNIAYALDININDIEKVPQYTDQSGEYDATNRAEYKVKGKGTFYFEPVDKNGELALTDKEAKGYRLINKETNKEVYNSVTNPKDKVTPEKSAADQAKAETNKQVKLKNEKAKLEQIYPAGSVTYDEKEGWKVTGELPTYYSTFQKSMTPQSILDMSTEEIATWKESIEAEKKQSEAGTTKKEKKQKKNKK